MWLGDSRRVVDVTDDGAVRDPDEQARLDAIAEADRARVHAANQLARNQSMVAEGRRKAGAVGAMMAGAMIAIRDIYEGPKKDEGVAVVESPTDPIDLDEDGVQLEAEEVGGTHDIAVPAQPRRAPIVAGRRASRRRR
jgi:hypothetical protein